MAYCWFANNTYFHAMAATDKHILNLLRCIDLEEKEQVQRYSLGQQHTLKSLKAEGLALHPIIVTRKNFGYADYPEISFRLAFPPEANMFKDGAAIEFGWQGWRVSFVCARFPRLD